MICNGRWYYLGFIFTFLVVLPLAVYAQANTAKLKKYDPTLLITTASVLQAKSENKEVVIIDIRQPEDYEKIRIPGSINMPLFSIKAKRYLASKSLIIVNEGYNYSQLESECIKLRNVGFKVYILQGGLYSWIQKGAPMEGNISARKKLNRVSPIIFIAEKYYANWIIIDISAVKKSHDPLPERSLFVPYTGDNDKFLRSIEESLEKIRIDEFTLVLICNENGKNYDKIEAILEKSKVKPVFFLEDGKEGLKNILLTAEKSGLTTGASEEKKGRTCK